ncbi:hypothetical protein A4A49_61637, partial [Nicotiana attenuata]
LSLRGKSKLGFVDGTCVKSMYSGELAEQWEKCNAIILFDRSDLTRIYHLWTAITTLRQGIDSVTSYFLKMKDLWDELDVLVPLSSCDYEEYRPSVEHLRSKRLLQFLMGLNESYSNIRSNVLAKRPVVIVNEAYAIVTQEEIQRSIGVVDTHREQLTMLAGKGRDFRARKPGENCFKIIGYPADFKSKRKNQPAGGKVYANNVNMYAKSEEGKQMNVQIQGAGQFFTEEQYQQLVRLLSKPTTAESSNNFAGIIQGQHIMSHIVWIFLTMLKGQMTKGKMKYNFPTGNKSQITHTRKAPILGNKTVNNVLYVPDFKFNLLSVSKITKDLCCSATLFSDFCILQDLYSGRV